ncbi:MAG: radical SAM protein [Nanoarchaeota archaeon]|nr:radical SAM protein [Nanoarchaeota archaeon]
MNVILIQPPTNKAIQENYVSLQIPINLAYIAASLEQKRANITVIDYCVQEFNKKKLITQLEQLKPKIIGFTSLTASIHLVNEISQIIKKHDKKIITILGGPHATALPKQTLEELKAIDIIVQGEGEKTIQELYTCIKTRKPLKTIKGIVFRRNKKIITNPKRKLIHDINKIVFPARHYFNEREYKRNHVSRGFSRKHLRIAEIITSRGCPGKCIFCAGHVNYGNRIRFRSFENIKQEIYELKQKYKINHITIEDDTFTINHELVKKIGKYLKQNNITWNCNTRVNTVNLELLQHMQKCGCKKVVFGVESGSEKILKIIRKGITLTQIRNAFKWAKQAKIRYVEGTFILGNHPQETVKDIEETKKLIFELMPDFLCLTIMCPFPGTPVYEIMQKQKLLPRKPDWSKFTFINNQPSYKKLEHVNSQTLIRIQNQTLKKYYTSPKYVIQQIRKIRKPYEIMYFSKLAIEFTKKFLMRETGFEPA